MSADAAALAKLFVHFADREVTDDPLYMALCRHVAAQPALLALMQHAPPTQRIPNLLLAAVHERVLAGVPHALREYFPSAGGTRAPDEALPALFDDFVAAQRDALCESLATRHTQTNEIGRCAVLWPALRAIAQRSGKPRLALLDVGCSAGLNLGVDTYRYDYGDGVFGAAPNPGVPLLSCRVVTPFTQGADFEIVHRRGIDPAPVDIDDDAALGWLRACLWPSDTARATRFTQAVALMKQRRWPVLRVADCTAHVAEWLSIVPADVQPVIFNSWVLTYFEPSALQRHIDTVVDLVRSTGAMWLSAEGPNLRIGPVDVPLALDPPTRSASLWTLCTRESTREGADVRFDLLARSHAHGRWMEWLDN